jgi:hypothetical protein
MKGLRVIELIAAVLCVAPWVVIGIAVPDLEPEDDAWILPLWIGGGVLAGVLSRSWWVSGLLSLVIGGSLLLGGALHPCVEGPGTAVECDYNGTALLVFYFVPLTFLIIASGVVIRKAVGSAAARLR